MIITSLVTAFSVFLAILLAGYIIIKRAKREIAEYIAYATQSYHDFTDSPLPGEPSALAILVNHLAGVAGDRIAVQLKMTLMGKASGQARGEAAIVNAMTEDALDAQSPMLASVMDQSPKLKKALMKNPKLMEMAMQFINKGGQGNGQNQQAQSAGSSTGWKKEL